MPEGDTIYRAARTLRHALEGQTVTSIESHVAGFDTFKLNGQTVQAIEARGKHLLFRFAPSELSLHSHMGMTGSWHVYRRGEAWRKSRNLAAVAVETNHTVCVCFTPKTLEFLTATQVRRHPYVSRLGPDILASVVDWPEIMRRLRDHNGLPIGEAILNQTILCGIGNVYKSEALFQQRRDPFASVGSFGDVELLELLKYTRRQMRRNLSGHPRRTRFAGDNIRLWVYGRQGGTLPSMPSDHPNTAARQLGSLDVLVPRLSTPSVKLVIRCRLQVILFQDSGRFGRASNRELVHNRGLLSIPPLTLPSPCLHDDITCRSSSLRSCYYSFGVAMSSAPPKRSHRLSSPR